MRLSFSHSSTLSLGNINADLTLADASGFFNILWRKFMALRTMCSLRSPNMVVVCVSMGKQFMLPSMNHILSLSNVFQIFRSIVCFYGVFVVHLKTFWLRTKKSICHNIMHEEMFTSQCHSTIPVTIIRRKDATSVCIPVIRISPESAKTGNRIDPFKSDYGFPFFTIKFFLSEFYGRLLARHLNPPYQGSVFRPVGKPQFLCWPIYFVAQNNLQVKEIP